MAAHCLARGLPRQVGLQVEHGGSGRTYGPRCAGPNVYRGTRRILRLSLWRGLAWFGRQHDKRSDATGDWCAHAAGKRTLQRTAGRLYLSSLPAHRRSDARRKLLSHPLVAFRLSHTLDRRVLPQWSAPRRLEHIPSEWKSACALDLFVIACPFRKTGFHPSGQARGHAFPGYALRARSFEVESTSRSRSLVEHDLFGKPVSTFPDHALAAALSFRPRRRRAAAAARSANPDAVARNPGQASPARFARCRAGSRACG